MMAFGGQLVERQPVANGILEAVQELGDDRIATSLEITRPPNRISQWPLTLGVFGASSAISWIQKRFEVRRRQPDP